jgi:hypothetical protein
VAQLDQIGFGTGQSIFFEKHIDIVDKQMVLTKVSYFDTEIVGVDVREFQPIFLLW